MYKYAHFHNCSHPSSSTLYLELYRTERFYRSLQKATIRKTRRIIRMFIHLDEIETKPICVKNVVEQRHTTQYIYLGLNSKYNSHQHSSLVTKITGVAFYITGGDVLSCFPLSSTELHILVNYFNRSCLVSGLVNCRWHVR